MHTGNTDRRLLWAALCTAIAVGFALRFASSFKSFWLDEIWSYYLAQNLDSLWDVISKRPHDNNHILNTLFIHLVGEREHWLWYRLLSVATGTASIYLMARAVRDRGVLEALTAAVLAAASYPLTVASAQSRGYAPAIFFSLLAYLLVQSYWKDRSPWTLAWFWLCSVLGILSHLSFLYAYVAIGVWSLARELEQAERPGSALRELAKCHAVPVAAVAGLYAVFYSRIVLGGGPTDYNALVVAKEAIASAVGVAGEGAPAVAGLVVAFAVLVAGLALLQREASWQWLFFLGALMLAPGMVLMSYVPKLFYPRYLVASVPFFYLLAAIVLAWIYRSSRAGRVIYAALLLLFVVAQGGATRRFLATGRTNYADALDYLDAHTRGPVIRLGSDHDFRNQMVIRFYDRHRSSDKKLVYVEEKRWSELGPEWYLMHSWLSGMYPPLRTVVHGRPFTRVARFDYGYGSGWTWFLYHNDARGAPPEAAPPPRG